MTRYSARLLVLIALVAVGCSRGARVEAGPASSEIVAIDITGMYDYVATFDSGETTSGPMTIARTGSGYTASFLSEMGEVTTSNVERSGDKLTMDAMTPGGPGRIELTWQNANELTGSVFLGDEIRLRATRRP